MAVDAKGTAGGDSVGQRRDPGSDTRELEHERPSTRTAQSYRVPAGVGLYSGPNSVRLHGRAKRWGLVARLTLPILAAVLVSMLLLVYSIQRQVANLHLDDVRRHAYPTARAVAKFGRILIAGQNHFLAAHPDYLTADKWKAGEHWLVEGNFISLENWCALLDAKPDDMVPVAALERAARKADLLDLRGLGGDQAMDDNRLLAAFVLDGDGMLIAANQDIPEGDPRHERSWVWFDAFFGLDKELAAMRAAGEDIRADYLSEGKHGELVRVVAPIRDQSDDSTDMGEAILFFQVDSLRMEQRWTAVTLVLPLGFALMAFIGLVTWFAARRVTKPIQRLAGDMLAIAEGDLDRRAPVNGNDEIAFLAQTFNSMAERLRVARENAVDSSRLESDLAIARSIQNSLLPPQAPRVRGLDIHTSYRPAKEIGGDYYDFLPIDSRHIGMIVADASGKSIPAALVMSTTRAILRFVAPGGVSAAETLGKVNSILSVDIPHGMFVTAYYIVYDPGEGSMICASAGHNPVILGRADGTVEMINPGGIALGFDQGPIFQRSIREQKIQLHQGDRVVMYTDGVVECANSAGEEYSDRRLKEFVRRHPDLSSGDFVGALLADLDRHRGTADIRDDTTLLTFRVL